MSKGDAENLAVRNPLRVNRNKNPQALPPQII